MGHSESKSRKMAQGKATRSDCPRRQKLWAEQGNFANDFVSWASSPIPGCQSQDSHLCRSPLTSIQGSAQECSSFAPSPPLQPQDPEYPPSQIQDVQLSRSRETDPGELLNPKETLLTLLMSKPDPGFHPPMPHLISISSPTNLDIISNHASTNPTSNAVPKAMMSPAPPPLLPIRQASTNVLHSEVG